MTDLALYTLRFVVDSAHHGLRIDTFLVDRLRNYSAAQLQRIAAAGLVVVNDTVASPERRVQRGEIVQVRLAEPPEPFYDAERLPLEVLYDDPWLIAINKPAGLLLHPTGPVGDGTVANILQEFVDRQSRMPGLIRPGIVHRLDRETSGIVVVAKDYESHRSLTQQFERGAIRKVYVALVSGQVERDHGEVTLPIGQRPGSLLMSAGRDALSARSATTVFHVLSRLRSASVLALHPGTGRKHQLRVHLAAMGHPILGDRYYASPPAETPFDGVDHTQHARQGRHALHAAGMMFRHPVTNAPLRVLARLPLDFWEPLSPGYNATSVDGGCSRK